MLSSRGLWPSKVKSAFGKAMSDVLDGRLGNRKGLGNLGFVPAIREFQQDPGSGEDVRIGLAVSHKPMGLGTLRFAERASVASLTSSVCFECTILDKKLNGLTTLVKRCTHFSL
jgi:hypothetical protein